MDVESALDLINTGIIYKPGWKFEADDHTNRFEGSIKVRITYPAIQTNKSAAKDGYQETIETYAHFPVCVADCDDYMTLHRRIVDAIIAIEEHETREAYRVVPTFDAPFHPHRIAGMRAWGKPERDFQFGIA